MPLFSLKEDMRVRISDIINNAIDELERAYELLKENETAINSMLISDIEASIERLGAVNIIELRNVINVYSELNPQIDIIFMVSDSNIARTYDLLKQAYDDWFNLELNPLLQPVPIGDYLSDELTKANIYHEIYYRAESEEENGNE